MKKAKIVLTAIAVVGTIGGALAFKAAKFGGIPYYTTAAFNAVATVTQNPAITTVEGSGAFKYFTTVYGDHATTSGYVTIRQ